MSLAPLTLPRLLNIPKKLHGLIREFDNFRIFLLEGGRGGAKSHSIARFLLYLGDRYNVRIACGRETLNSIDESVYQLLVDLITEYGMEYDITNNEIRHRTKKTVFTFIGLLERGRFNVQSIEGIDILWIEEGQAIAKATMDTLMPTIRKTNSKIIISMNRYLLNDPAYAMTVGRPDCLHLPINYLENEHCSAELLNEANICKSQNQEDYLHIWMGQPANQTADALYTLQDFELGRANHHLLRPGYGLRVAGFDIARMGDDKCAAVILQQMGALHWEEIFCDQWGKLDLNWTTGRILEICNEYKVDMAAIDVDGLGAGPFDTLNKGRQLDYFVPFRNPPISYEKNKNYGNERTVNAYKFKEAIAKGHRNIKTQDLIDELLSIKYTFDHSQRRILVSKDKMKSLGFKSPNLADAVIMAESLIGKVKQKQDNQYQPRDRQSSSPEDSLFKIAGIQ